MGSAPGDNTKISGAQQFESANDPARSKVGGSMYDCPRLSTMNSCTEGTILSGRKHLSTTILSMPCKTSNGLGYFSCCGVGESYTFFQEFMLSITSVMRTFIITCMVDAEYNIVHYIKTCVKQPLKKDKTKILMTSGSLMKVESMQNAPIGAFCNTFDLH